MAAKETKTTDQRNTTIVLTGMVAGLVAWGAVMAWPRWYFWPILIVGTAVTALLALASMGSVTVEKDTEPGDRPGA